MMVIVDYGVIGNIYSLEKALKRFTSDVIVSSDPAMVESAHALILPGVGAFHAGMEGLVERGLSDVLRTAAKRDVPILGICLGAQLLMERSEEMGEWKGLGILPGSVVPLSQEEGYPVPHIGWAPIHATQGKEWSGTILEGVAPHDEMYFVHSFMIEAPHDTLAQCKYGPTIFTAALKRGTIYALQFHPEKSGEAGLRILSSFVSLCQKK